MDSSDDTAPTDPALARRVRSALGQRPAPPDPEAARQRVRALFTEAFGAAATAAAFAPVYAPLSGEHTAYFDGLALLLRLPGGVSVAVGRASGPARLVVQRGDARPRNRAMDAGIDGWGENAALARLVRALVRAQGAPADGLSVALHLAPPTPEPDALLAATASATGRAFATLFGAEEGVVATGAEAVSEVLGRPFGPALLIAAAKGSPLVLADAATHGAEALPEPEHMGWGFVDTRRAPEPVGSSYRHRVAVLDDAVADLRRGGFEGLRSLRGLDHRDVPDALDSLRGEAKRIVRYLAGEDRRVQRLLVALRKGDGQVVGAHLLMSEASRRDDWQAGTPEAEFVVREVEKAEGIYGARTVGGGVGGGLLVVGRPFLVPPFLDALAERFEAEFGIRPATSVL
ncbi:MAG: hypothetical protein ABJF88_08960 [Rhodothermales bacterium]